MCSIIHVFYIIRISGLHTSMVVWPCIHVLRCAWVGVFGRLGQDRHSRGSQFRTRRFIWLRCRFERRVTAASCLRLGWALNVPNVVSA